MTFSTQGLTTFNPEHRFALAVAESTASNETLTARSLWGKDRGHAPIGYLKGMSLMYARAYSWWLLYQLPISLFELPEMPLLASQAGSNDKKDALRRFAPSLTGLGLNVETPGLDALRALYSLLFSLGMRESSGRYRQGWDRGKVNGWNGKGKPVEPTADNGEAGLFQMSYDGGIRRSLNMKAVHERYASRPENGLLSVFKEGIKAKPSDSSYGKGPGFAFQELSKQCPAMTVELAAIGLRVNAGHWGPINKRTITFPEAVLEHLKRIEILVSSEAGHEVLLW